MDQRLKPIIPALAAALVINFVGVMYFYGPIAADDIPGGPLVPRAAGFFISMLLAVLFFDW